MRRNEDAYRVFWDESVGMFGIEDREGQRAQKISTDFDETDHLAQLWCRCDVSPTHFLEIVEDYRRA